MGRLFPLVCFIFVSGSEIVADVGDPLFLTPYIINGQITEAKELSRVQNLTASFLEPMSYSGFITVNATHNANLFFWFFPAQSIPDDAPVILWCEGGPGFTGMYPLFNGNGPFRVDRGLTLHLREYSWTMENSVIFIDHPANTGFSFTSHENGYLTNSLDPTHLYEFLQQFFTLFPEFLDKDFYAGGHSFGGGKYAPTVAKEIHERNKERDSHAINLKGVIMEAPWANPLQQLDYGDFLYSVGILDQHDRDNVQVMMELEKQLIRDRRYAEAFMVWTNVLMAPDSYIQNRTGLDYGDLVENYIGHQFVKENSGDEYFFYFYLRQDFVRKAIHVGNTTFIVESSLPIEHYEDKGLITSVPTIETLLNATEGYKVLVYTGQLDVITYHYGIRNVIDSLEWTHAEEFRRARAYPFDANSDGQVNGFVTQAGNLTYLTVRNAGHDVTGDQRPVVWDAVHRFINNKPFTE